MEDISMDNVVKAIEDYYKEKPESHVQYAMKIDKESGNYEPYFYYTSTGGKLSPGDESKNKLKQTMIKCMSAGWYVNENDTEKRSNFETQANKLRKFDDNSFNRAIYLNDSDGAYGAGHNAVMLMNESGASVVFSFYPQREKLPDALWMDAEMRFSVLTPEETKQVLYGDGYINNMVASDYEVQNENYDGHLCFDIDNAQGYNMYHEAVRLFDNPGDYLLLLRQCDDIASWIFKKGNIFIDTLPWPNGTHNYYDKINKIRGALT